jgi:hypothetical protein
LLALAKPVLLAMEEDAALDELRGELEARYAQQYQVVCLQTPTDARSRLTELADAGEEVAVVLAGGWRPDESGGQVLDAAAGEDPELPLLVMPDGTVLENPTNAEIAASTGGPIHPDRMEFDVVIVGAGPAGLSAAVYGASEGFSTLVVDKGGVGGQASRATPATGRRSKDPSAV